MNNIYDNIEKFINVLEHSEKIVIAGHTSPDGDAICASISLAMAIKKMNKKPIVLLESYPDTYEYIAGKDLVYTDDYNKIEADLFISVDCGDKTRLGEAEKVLSKIDNTVNIDHHISNNNFAKLNIVNDKASSTSEVIFEILNMMGLIDKEIATALYTGIVFDTSGFKHSSTGKRTHQIAGELIDMGVDSSYIHTRLLYTHSLENSKVLACAIQNIEIYGNKAITFVTKEEIFEKCNANYDALDGIVGYILDIKDVEVAVFLYEKVDGLIKASFRALKANVNEIAKSFGGGGHILASGATLNMSMEEAKSKILEAIKDI